MSGLPNLTYGLSRTIPHLDHLSVDLTPHAWYHIMNWTVESVIQGGAPDATHIQSISRSKAKKYLGTPRNM